MDKDRDVMHLPEGVVYLPAGDWYRGSDGRNNGKDGRMPQVGGTIDIRDLVDGCPIDVSLGPKVEIGDEPPSLLRAVQTID